MGRVLGQLPGVSSLRGLPFQGLSGIPAAAVRPPGGEGRHALGPDSFWRQVHAALSRSSSQVQRKANCHWVPAPANQPGQKVWLNTKDLPL